MVSFLGGVVVGVILIALVTLVGDIISEVRWRWRQ